MMWLILGNIGMIFLILVSLYLFTKRNKQILNSINILKQEILLCKFDLEQTPKRNEEILSKKSEIEPKIESLEEKIRKVDFEIGKLQKKTE